jgi:pSer/pThr/pTyr-binding forkhead associated (FHA) protein
LGSDVVRLHIGENVIGRDPDAAVVIDSPDVSRLHAKLLVSADMVVLHDLGSRNGTFVAGERITEPRVVRHGDQITIGRTTIVLEELKELASTV